MYESIYYYINKSVISALTLRCNIQETQIGFFKFTTTAILES